MGWLAEEMEISLPQELDFEREMENAEVTRGHFEKLAGSMLRIPEMIWAKKRILVMECTDHILPHPPKSPVSRPLRSLLLFVGVSGCVDMG